MQPWFETRRTQVGYSRLAQSILPISGKPGIGATLLTHEVH